MSDRLLVSTRKGLFFVGRTGSGWHVEKVAFLGENVTLALPTSGGVFAALFVLMIIASGLHELLKQSERVMLRWREESQSGH